MNLIDSTSLTLMLRAAKSEARKARRQWPQGVALCVMAAAMAAMFLFT